MLSHVTACVAGACRNRYLRTLNEGIIFRALCGRDFIFLSFYITLWILISRDAHFLFVAEIVEGVRRGGGSPLRPVIDDASVEQEVNINKHSKYIRIFVFIFRYMHINVLYEI